MNPDPRETRLTILAMAVFFALLVGAMVWWEKRKAARRAASFPNKDGGPPVAPPLIRHSGIIVVLCLMLIFWMFVPKHPKRGPGNGPPPRAPLSRGMIAVFVVPPALVLGWIGFILYRSFRHYDRAMNRAIARANAGDKEGALADVRAEIAAKGLNGARANALGVLHYFREEWDEAAAMIDEAERLGYNKATCAMNRAMIRYRSGHPDDALTVLQAQYAKLPDDPVLGCNLCSVLMELGRLDDARRTLAEIERRRKNSVYLGGSGDAVDRLIRDCHERLEGKPRKTSLSEFDEL
jgi:hypothetical protein